MTAAAWRREAAALGALLVLFAASRAAVSGLGVSPDPTAFDGLWQNLPLEALRTDYWGALAGLRSQPPLWNALVGAIARACGGDLWCAASAMQAGFMALTLVAALALRATLGLAGARPWLAWGAAWLLALSPSAAFFELFPLYPQPTMALAALAGLALAGLARVSTGDDDGRGLRRLAGLYAAMTALCLTWSLFHPAFLPLAALAAALAGGGPRRLLGGPALRPAGLALLAGFTLLAALPAMRNQAEHGLFANGTWGGMNLAQTVPFLPPETRRSCEFSAVIERLNRAHPGLEAKALHLPEAAEISRECLDRAVGAILTHPWGWLRGRLAMAELSHRLWPYEYVQYRPLGWERLPIPDAARAQDPAGGGVLNMSAALLGGWPTLGWYALIAFGLAWAFASGGFGPAFGLAAALSLLVVGEEGMAHLFNGAEQARMRWTVEPLILALAALVAEAWLRRRRDGRSG
ncbi:MAG: hypothetical protein VYD87_08800 [Pseudomonadota bacterium]|nr:hypothetical protein [Pseudomonadota bacterium]